MLQDIGKDRYEGGESFGDTKLSPPCTPKSHNILRDIPIDYSGLQEQLL